MKTLDNFILERLKLNKSSKISYKEWSIKDAKPGDIITCKENNVKNNNNFFVFIFKTRNNNKIYDYGCYYGLTNNFYKTVDDNAYWPINNNTNYWLANEEEQKKFFDAMKKANYEWDENKLEFKSI